MVKKSAKKSQEKKRIEKNIEQKVDVFSRILQLVALVTAGILLLADILVDTYELPGFVVPIVLGLAIGLSPQQIGKIVTDIIKTSVTGKRR